MIQRQTGNLRQSFNTQYIGSLAYLWAEIGMNIIRLKQTTLLFSILLLACAAGAQATGDKAPVDSSTKAPVDSFTIIQRMKAENIPALGFAYIGDGQVRETRVYGELKHGVPAPFNTIFNVASITKTITTLITLRLVDAGKWNLDEPVCHYWTDPDVKDDPRSKKLTTRHILTHQTGFPNWRWSAASKKLAFEFEPGDHFQYSGEGMEYLRRALESKFHRSLEQLADSLIFGPLKMKDSHLIWNDGMLGHFAVPHNAKGEELEISKNTEPNAADLFKTTVGDYSRFVIWVINGAGLSKALYQEMTSPLSRIKEDKYMGLGWAVYPKLPGGQAASQGGQAASPGSPHELPGSQYGLSHSGSDPGVNTIVIILPQSKRALLIFTNSDNGTRIYSDLVKGYLKEQGNAIFNVEMKD
jgi:CubicO group peptidase (beta-lactamase class C family)